MMKHLWHEDPFKAKWSILAKSYSRIRDVKGKPCAPLDQFLAVNGTLIGLIPPAEYLATLGWSLQAVPGGQMVLHRQAMAIDHSLTSTNKSVNDIIMNCSLHGYVTGDISSILLTNDEAELSMSAPTFIHKTNDRPRAVTHEADTNQNGMNRPSLDNQTGSQDYTSGAVQREDSDAAIHDHSLDTSVSPQTNNARQLIITASPLTIDLDTPSTVETENGTGDKEADNAMFANEITANEDIAAAYDVTAGLTADHTTAFDCFQNPSVTLDLEDVAAFDPHTPVVHAFDPWQSNQHDVVNSSGDFSPGFWAQFDDLVDWFGREGEAASFLSVDA